MNIRTNLALTGILCAVGAGPLAAQSTGFCDASQKLLDKVHENLTEWAVPEEVDRMGMINIMMRASLALAFATDEVLEEALLTALNLLVIARDNDDPERLPNDEVPAAIYDNIQIVAGFMPELCPNIEVPDFSAFAHFSPE